MIARAKTNPADCRADQPNCLPIAGHVRQQLRRKLILPAKRYRNEPFACEVLPLHREDHRLLWFDEPAVLEPSEHYSTFEGMATFLAEWEWGSVANNYPRSCQSIEYLTAVQWAKRVVAIVIIGSPENVGRQMLHGFDGVFDSYVIALSTHWNRRAGCILLHSHWGEGFIRGIQRGAERQLEQCLGRPPEWKRGEE